MLKIEPGLKFTLHGTLCTAETELLPGLWLVTHPETTSGGTAGEAASLTYGNIFDGSTWSYRYPDRWGARVAIGTAREWKTLACKNARLAKREMIRRALLQVGWTPKHASKRALELVPVERPAAANGHPQGFTRPFTIGGWSFRPFALGARQFWHVMRPKERSHNARQATIAQSSNGQCYIVETVGGNTIADAWGSWDEAVNDVLERLKGR
jgi:hypothetical protein